MTTKQLTAIAVRIRAALFDVPPDRQMEVLKVQLDTIPPEFRAPVEDLVLTGATVGGNVVRSDRSETLRRDLRFAAFAGVVFIVVLIVIAIEVPNPTGFQYWVFRVVLSSAAAACGALIPGFLTVNMSLGTAVAIRSSGALALFVLVYFLNPAELMAGANQPPSTNVQRWPPSTITASSPSRPE